MISGKQIYDVTCEYLWAFGKSFSSVRRVFKACLAHVLSGSQDASHLIMLRFGIIMQVSDAQRVLRKACALAAAMGVQDQART